MQKTIYWSACILGVDKAYPLRILNEAGIIHDQIEGREGF